MKLQELTESENKTVQTRKLKPGQVVNVDGDNWTVKSVQQNTDKTSGSDFIVQLVNNESGRKSRRVVKWDVEYDIVKE